MCSLVQRKATDEGYGQGIRCLLYEKQGPPGVADYVKYGNEGWPKDKQPLVFVKGNQTAEEAVRGHKRFPEIDVRPC